MNAENDILLCKGLVINYRGREAGGWLKEEGGFLYIKNEDGKMFFTNQSNF